MALSEFDEMAFQWMHEMYARKVTPKPPQPLGHAVGMLVALCTGWNEDNANARRYAAHFLTSISGALLIFADSEGIDMSEEAADGLVDSSKT